MEIGLKWGIIKRYNFDNEEFAKRHEQLLKDLNKIFDELYKNNCSAFGASQSNKNNQDLKIRLCDLLDEFFDLNVTIINDYDDKKYKTKESYRKYILEYN